MKQAFFVVVLVILGVLLLNSAAAWAQEATEAAFSVEDMGSIAVGETIAGELPITVRHRYTLAGTGGEVVSIFITTADSPLDAYLRVYDTAGDLLAENDDLFGLDSGLSLTLPTDGTLVIEVGDFEDLDGSYMLTVLADDHLLVLLQGCQCAETLLALIDAAGLSETVAGLDNATLLLPTPEAFDGIPEDVQAALLEDPETLSNILLLHVVPSVVDDIFAVDSLTTAAGVDLQVAAVSDALVSIDERISSSVDLGSVTFGSSIVYVVDGVIGTDAATLDQGAIEVGSEVNGDLPLGQRHSYNLTLADAATLDVSVSTIDLDMLDTVLRIYDEAGLLVALNDDREPEVRFDSLLSALTLEPGTYTIEVGSFAAAFNGPYTLSVTPTEG